MCAKPLQARGEIFNQVSRVFKPDLQADERAGGLPAGRGADGKRVNGQCKAFKPAPAITNPEMRQPVNKCSACCFVPAIKAFTAA